MLFKLWKWTWAYVRRLLWKLRFGARLELGKRVYIGSGCSLRIGKNGRICLKDAVYLSEGCTLEAGDAGEILMESGAYCNTGCRIYAMEKIRIGKDCLFGSNVSVYDHDHDISRGVAKAGKAFVVKPVWIEDHVWCGTNSIITKGTRIGENCVLGAGGVASGILEPDGLYVGVPAVRKRDIPRE